VCCMGCAIYIRSDVLLCMCEERGETQGTPEDEGKRTTKNLPQDDDGPEVRKRKRKTSKRERERERERERLEEEVIRRQEGSRSHRDIKSRQQQQEKEKKGKSRCWSSSSNNRYFTTSPTNKTNMHILIPKMIHVYMYMHISHVCTRIRNPSYIKEIYRKTLLIFPSSSSSFSRKRHNNE